MDTWFTVLLSLSFVSAEMHPPNPFVPVSERLLEEIVNIHPMNASRRQSEVESLRQQRIVSQATSTTATVKVNSQTSLFVQPNQVATLYFDVTNNYNYNMFFYFYSTSTSSTIQSVLPYEEWISARDTITVKVQLQIGISTSTTETVTFSAVTYTGAGKDWNTVKALLYIGQQVSDSTSPDISYSINGDCRGSSTPSTCGATTWGITATIQDAGSGLLSVESVPRGFVFTSDFIAGTKNSVSGRYTASCCFNEVDLIATDLNGNRYKVTVDINNVWLSTAAISAIVLACILLVLILIAMGCCIAYCIRRHRRTKTIYVTDRG